jgi:hypothetical protein
MFGVAEGSDSKTVCGGRRGGGVAQFFLVQGGEAPFGERICVFAVKLPVGVQFDVLADLRRHVARYTRHYNTTSTPYHAVISP